MRRDCLHLFPLISLLLLFSTLSHGQPWSGILSPSRAIDWGHAGLEATFPNGETTANPWTPPSSRPTCTTVSTLTNIISVMASCATSHPGGSVVILSAAGSPYTVASTTLRFYGTNYVTLRGEGPMRTTINLTGTAHIEIGADGAAGSGKLTSAPANFTVGNSSVVVTTNSPPAVGVLAWFAQCNTGLSGTPCVGTQTDNNGLFVCGLSHTCDLSGGSSPTNTDQQQTVVITSVANNGNGTYTIGFKSGLYMPNWSFGQTPTLTWEPPQYVAIGVGLEDMTIAMQTTQDQQVSFNDAYNSWIKGVRFVGGGQNRTIGLGRSKNCLVFNNYIYSETPSSLSSSIQNNINVGMDSDDLILNNILTGGIAVEGGYSPQADVIAYNYNRDVQATYYQATEFLHQAGTSFILREGNQFDLSEDDNTWGTHNLNTWFRNYYACWDSPFVTLNPRALQIDNFARFENVIGNALGGTPCTAGYEGKSASLGYIYVIPTSDALALNSLMRWGNCDTVTGTCRFQSSEVPTSLSGNAAPFINSVPGDQSLPASFFMNGVTAHLSGGTGLSWWKVCTNWTTFPTTCASAQTPPFPTSGPDVASGPYVNGHSYDIPAALAFRTLPIDTTYQNSYNVTSSNWSNGTETLTVSGLPNPLHLLGPFQIAGGACSTGTGEAYMTGSSSTTVSYALASNPGSCAGGTLKFPNVRQFDERVYQSDSTGDLPPDPPTGLAAGVR